MTSPHFLLVGNGPYRNRGCEAIVRGTMAILRREFGEDFRVTVGTFSTPEVFAEQAKNETDPLVTHVVLPLRYCKRWTMGWWRRHLIMRWLPEMWDKTYSKLDRFCSDATCALQIGGDNYSLDYGRPAEFISLDGNLHSCGVPIVLWGASVGPFESDPEFAQEMYANLRKMRAIFVRESESYEYLQKLGIDANLHRMSDPAFVMEPVEPSADKIRSPVPSGAIGLNLSPLMAKFVTGGDLNAWVRLAINIVQSIVEGTDRDVLLIPHVTWGNTNDHSFLQRVADACSKAQTKNVSCLGGNLSAAETKWVISRCAIFVGARTHATIAAISSAVPTLSLAYSRKARGLNQDIFGSQNYCLQPTDILPAVIAERVVALLGKREAIVDHLVRSLPRIRESALHSGTILRGLIENR